MLSGGGPLTARSGLDPALLTGVPLIDDEHLALVGQLDALEGNEQAHPRSEVFSEILSRLGAQISKHFDDEEVVLNVVGMPADLIAGHVQAHIDILDQYTRLNLDLMRGEPLDRSDVLLMIKGWIIDHVLDFDIRIRDYC